MRSQTFLIQNCHKIRCSIYSSILYTHIYTHVDKYKHSYAELEISGVTSLNEN